MKVLMLNGSPRAHGNTARALQEMETVFAREGIETEIIHLGNKDIRSCVACGHCGSAGKCVFDDIVNELAVKFEECTAWWWAARSTMPRPTPRWWPR